jgi:hypothetical protein
MIRTGIFQFINHDLIPDFHARGWMIVDDLGSHHGRWSALMWRCSCGVAT